MEMIKILGAAFTLIGTLAGSTAIIAMLMAMLKFPLLLVAVLAACWMLGQLPAAKRFEL